MGAMELGVQTMPATGTQQVAARAKDAQVAVARLANDAPLLRGLAGHVTACWEEARQARQAVLPRLQAAARARSGKYSPDKMKAIRAFGGSEVYLRVCANKSMILAALLKDVYLGQTDKPWSLKPTACPTFPASVANEVRDQLAQEVAAFYAQFEQLPDQASIRAAHATMQETAEARLREIARKMTERMERKMADQLSAGGFEEALAAFLDDFVTMPAAILKGPTLRKRKVRSWGTGADGKTVPTVAEEIIPEFERVDPFRAYPSAGSDSPQKGFFIEHLSLEYSDLFDMIGSPGVNESAVRAALSEADNGGLSDWMGWSEFSDTPDPDNVAVSLKRKTFNIDCVLFYGPVKGRDLIEWGIEDPIDDPDASVEAAVWMVGKWVVKAHLNYDPLGVRPYFHASYSRIPSQFHGESVPDLLSDIAGDDGLMQVAARALANNMSMASGPMVGINTDRLQPGETIDSLHPWQMFQLRNGEYANQSDRPLEFFQPQMHAQELLAILDKMYQLADSFSMIPRSAAGDSPTGGVGRTASGFAMQLDAAGKGLKAAVMNIDTALARMLSKLYDFNMQFDPDETLKGDAQVLARGATSLMQMESLRIRRNEALQATNNPTDLQIMGIEGRAEILRTTFDDLEIDVTRVIPSREKLAQMAAPQPAPPAQGALPAPTGPAASQEMLPTGQPATDNFSQNPMTPQPGAAPQGFAVGGLVSPEEEYAKNTTPGVNTFQEFQVRKLEQEAARIQDDEKRFSSYWVNNPQQIAERRVGLLGEAKALGSAMAAPTAPATPAPDAAAQQNAQNAQNAQDAVAPSLAPKRRVSSPSLTDLSTGIGKDPDPLGLS